MNHTLRQLRRLRAGDVIVAGDVELVQQIEMTVDPGKRPTRQQTEEARRLLQAGKGWKFLPVEAWLVGKKVKETAHGLCAARSVWRKRVTGPNRGKGRKNANN